MAKLPDTNCGNVTIVQHCTEATLLYEHYFQGTTGPTYNMEVLMCVWKIRALFQWIGQHFHQSNPKGNGMFWVHVLFHICTHQKVYQPWAAMTEEWTMFLHDVINISDRGGNFIYWDSPLSVVPYLALMKLHQFSKCNTAISKLHLWLTLCCVCNCIVILVSHEVLFGKVDAHPCFSCEKLEIITFCTPVYFLFYSWVPLKRKILQNILKIKLNYVLSNVCLQCC